MISNLSEYDYIECADNDNVVIEDDGTDGGVDDAAKPNRRRLMDGSSKKNVEDLLEDLWWDLSSQMSMELRVALTAIQVSAFWREPLLRELNPLVSSL